MTGLVVFVALSMALIHAALAGTITPNFDANLTQAQKDIIQQKIDLWAPRLAEDVNITIDFSNADLGATQFGIFGGFGPGVEPVIALLPPGEWLTLGVTDQFQQDAQERPTHARIRFNNNAAVPWHVGGEPVPAGKYDFWTVVNHEICHAVGFAVAYTKFNGKVTPGPGDKRTYTCGGTTATLTPESGGTHLDPTAHPGDLMNPEIGTGERRTPSALDINMIACVWPREIPALDKWGLVLLALVLSALALWILTRRSKMTRFST